MACDNMALIIGIDKYAAENYGIVQNLTTCENDAKLMMDLLRRDYKGETFFSVETLLSNKARFNTVSDRVNNLFNSINGDTVLFYFAGHAVKNSDDTYLLTTDYSATCSGISMHYLLCQAARHPNKKKIIILDCCFSGSFGNYDFLKNLSMIPENTVILASTSSRDKAYGYGDENGVFTSLLRDALESNIGNIFGEVTTEDVYKYISSALTPWQQTPIYKANISKPIVLKKTQPKISLEDLKKMTEIFVTTSTVIELSEEYLNLSETTTEELINIELFSLFEKLYRYGLITPSMSNINLYQAALNNQSIELTNLGKFYHECYINNKI